VLIRLVIAVSLLVFAPATVSADAGPWPAPVDGTYVVPEFRYTARIRCPRYGQGTSQSCSRDQRPRDEI